MPNIVKARPAGWNHAAVENDSDQPDPTDGSENPNPF